MEITKQANILLNMLNGQVEEKVIANYYTQLIGSEPNVVTRAKVLVSEARRNFKNGDVLIDKLMKIDAKFF